MKRVLALDTSTKTGWAHDNREGNAPISGTLKLGGWEPDKVAASFAKLHTFIVDMIAAHEITDVVIEKPLSVYAHSGFEAGGKWQGKARKNADLAEALLGFVAVAQAAAVIGGAVPWVAAPSSVRLHFVGRGRPADPKLAVCARARALGWKFEDDNAADALATWDYGKSILSPGWASTSTPLFAKDKVTQ